MILGDEKGWLMIIADYSRQFITWNRHRSRNRLKCHVLQVHKIIVVTYCSKWHRLSLSLVAVKNHPSGQARCYMNTSVFRVSVGIKLIWMIICKKAHFWGSWIIGPWNRIGKKHKREEWARFSRSLQKWVRNIFGQDVPRWLTWLEDTQESRNYTQGHHWVGGRHVKGCGKEWWVRSLLWVRQPALETRPKKGTSRGGRQILRCFRKK